ncbi:MAG: radical SAM protein [Rhizomicrobium sp.]
MPQPWQGKGALIDDGSPPPKLDTIHFNATKTCNLGCAFCYDKAIRGKTENLPLDIVEQIAADAAELGARRVILSGGEPMARTDWRDVARIFDMQGMEISLATNGTLITESVAQFLSGLKHVTLSISIDGGREIHDRLRDQQGAYDRTLSGLAHLRAAGVDFDMNATIFKANLADVPQLTKISRDFDSNMRFSLLHPNGRGETMAAKELSAEQIFELREYCHTMRKLGVKVFINLPPLLQYLDEIIPARGAACGWAVNFCGVLSNGDVTICGVASDEPDLVAGNVKQTRFRDIWSMSPLFRHTRALDTRKIEGICGRCPFNTFCGGACRLSAFREHDDFLAPYALCQKFYDEGYIPEGILDSQPAVAPH